MDYLYLKSTHLLTRIRDLSTPLDPQPTDYPEQLPELEGIRAVIFDIYGTLLISGTGDIGAASAETNKEAFSASLATAGFPASALNAFAPSPELLRQAIRKAHEKRHREGIEYPEVDILQIWEQVSDHLSDVLRARRLSTSQIQALALDYECRTNPVWPMPGLRETLDLLRSKGLLLGIVSNAQFYTPLLFRALLGATPAELGFRPELSVWSYQAQEAKPSTRLFRRVFERLASGYDIEPAEVLYVGNDCLKDMWPVQRMGGRTALFAGDRRSLRLREDDERCRDVRPDLVITDLRQLGPVLID